MSSKSSKPKQASLFSFFNKKANVPGRGSFGGAKASPKSAPITPATTKPAQPNGPSKVASHPNPSTSTKKTKATIAFKTPSVGRKLRVWDGGENKWNEGRITEEKTGVGTVRVTYDGDVAEVEELNLDNEKFEWLDDDSEQKPAVPQASKEKSKKTLAPSLAAAAVPMKCGAKKRRAVVDSDDEEAEFDADDKPAPKKAPQSKAAKGKKKAKVVTSDDEEEEEEDDFDIGGGDDDEEEYDVGSSAGDESESDGFLVDSDSEADEVPAKKKTVKKRPAPKKAAAAVAPSKKRTAVGNATPKATPAKAAKAGGNTASLFRTPASASGGSGGSATKKASAGSAPASAGGGGGGDDSPAVGGGGGEGTSLTYAHMRWAWYSDAEARDGDGVPVAGGAADGRSLKVPPSFMESQSPAQMQWWDLKSRNRDLVFLFKIGKFYEMYHKDADIGVKHAGLTYMRGETAHCGFPELGYGRYAEVLCAKGFRVARVEQTETVDDNKARAKTCPKHLGKVDKALFKVTAREVCSVLSPGTRTYGHFDAMSHSAGGGQQSPGGKAEEAHRTFLDDVGYVAPTTTTLLAIKEVPVNRATPQRGGGGGGGGEEEEEEGLPVVCEYGVCLMDCPTGSVMLGQFADDAQRTRLRTLLTQYPPAEVLTEKGVCSDDTQRILTYMCGGALKDDLAPGSEFWGADATAEHLLRPGAYFTSPMNAQGGAAQELPPLPPVLAAVLGSGAPEGAGSGAPEGAALAVSALGACVWLLVRSKVDTDVLCGSAGNFCAYVPPDLDREDLDREDLDEERCGRGGGGKEEEEEEEGGRPGGEPAATMSLAKLVGQAAAQAAAGGGGGGGEGGGGGVCQGVGRLSDLAWVATGQRPLGLSGGGSFGPDAQATSTAAGGAGEDPVGSRMVLDGAALTNLEVLHANDGKDTSASGGGVGSLLRHLDRTVTPPGKRLLKAWLAAPLLRVDEVEARQSAVEALSGGGLSCVEPLLKAKVKKVGDLERLLKTVRALGSKKRATEHPDSRARIFDADKIEKRKVGMLAELLSGMQAYQSLFKALNEMDLEEEEEEEEEGGPLLTPLMRLESGGGLLPELGPHLAFASRLDLKSAKATGRIEPQPGMDAEFDQALEDMASTKRELEGALAVLRQGPLQGSGARWWHHKTKLEDTYQVEVESGWLKAHPDALSAGPETFISTSQTTKVRRFQTAAIGALLGDLGAAQARADACRTDAMRKVFARFAEAGDVWGRAVRCVASLDALCALAQVSAQPGYVRPTFVPDDEKTEGAGAVLDLQQARHPCLALPPGAEAIPNDTTLGGDEPRLLLLTGPNMGGKSTLLRQTCLVAILAQVGCFVPCESAVLSVVDRIFTRLGASDRILAGQSTLMVELSEAATVLHKASTRSLVILDELGRGTSTFDGTALAHAVCHHLAVDTRCRTLFATHYHSLVEEWGSPVAPAKVQLGHMACVVGGRPSAPPDRTPLAPSAPSAPSAPEGPRAVDAEGGAESITFLYTLAAGSSPRSFGVNVARLAKLPDKVLALASAKSRAFEDELKASHSWMAAVAIGKCLLAAAAAAAASAGEPGGADAAGATILECWKRAQENTAAVPAAAPTAN